MFIVFPDYIDILKKIFFLISQKEKCVFYDVYKTHKLSIFFTLVLLEKRGGGQNWLVDK